ncbi:MAG: S8 family peptidase [Pirellulales bacterium]|nr:S8 family peptidase [Pirellulales bacterium]
MGDGQRGVRFRLPPFRVQEVLTSLAETVDWGWQLCHVPEAWRQSRGETVRVAVLDSGIDERHPDLVEAIDDARDFTSSRRGPSDANGHGTHCAGIIGARQNDVGMIGVAPACRLLVARVLDAGGSGLGEWIANGMDWACDEGADILSMSLGAPAPDEQIGQAIERATAKGKFVICAAGNSGRADDVNYPARWKGRPHADRDSIAVGAVDAQGRVTRFSSRGPEVDIAAPGENVLSTYLRGGYARLSGTSMATPFVAGVVALVLARQRAAGQTAAPMRTLTDLREQLRHTARDAGETGKDDAYGYGLIDPGTMLAEPSAPPEPQPVFAWGGFKLYVPARAGDLFSVG